jgi:tellurite resistance protein TerC
LQEGLAIILAFVGVKMLIHSWYHIPTWLSLTVIVIVLVASIGFSMKYERNTADAELAAEAFEPHSPSESEQPPNVH